MEPALHRIHVEGSVEERRRRVSLDLPQYADPGLGGIALRAGVDGNVEQRIRSRVAVLRDIGAAGTAPGLRQAARRRILYRSGKIDIELSGRPSLDPERKLHLLQLKADADLAELF